LTKQRFLIHLILIALFFFLVLFLTMQWLKSYTNHGQKMELPNYVGEVLKEAVQDAKEKSFEVIVKDSIHKVGKPGGLILSQNPKSGSVVKEKRKVYVTVTKYNADEVKSEYVTANLYGQDFSMVESRLINQEFVTKIKSRVYDKAEPNHILEVWYDGQKITDRNTVKKDVYLKKGSTISFVLSKNNEGQKAVPDLMCQTLEAARFNLESSRLNIGEIIVGDDIEDAESAYISKQVPDYSANSKIAMGSSINVYLSKSPPKGCN